MYLFKTYLSMALGFCFYACVDFRVSFLSSAYESPAGLVRAPTNTYIHTYICVIFNIYTNNSMYMYVYNTYSMYI